jgi:superfamily II DNA or RNA helicase
MKLRPYQQECLDTIKEQIKLSSRVLIQLPTGMGKTVIFANLIKELNQRTLVIAHREELLQQAKQKIMEVTNHEEEEIDIVLQSQPKSEAKVWIASIQTLARSDSRMEKITPELIIIDEAHHSVAKSYRKVMDRYGVTTIGFTATPTRGNYKEKVLFKNLWKKMSFEMTIEEGIKQGYLANIEYYRVDSACDISGVKMSGGDFNLNSLSQSVNVFARNEACVDVYLERGGGKCVVFAVDVKHVEDLKASFVNRGIKTFSVVGSTEKEERRFVLHDFKEAKTDENVVIINCMVLTEGWDCPDVRMVILARPTKSETVYLQALGRGTRIVPGVKEKIIIIDIVDNGKKGMCSLLRTVFNINPKSRISGNVMQKKKQLEAEQAEQFMIPGINIPQEKVTMELLTSIFREVPLEFAQHKMKWFSDKDYVYKCNLGSYNFITVEDVGLYFQLKHNHEVITADPDIKNVLKWSLEIANEKASDYKYVWCKERSNQRKEEAPTKKQMKVLREAYPDMNLENVNKDTAGTLIAKLYDNNKATEKQINYLRRLGYLGEVENLTKTSAGRLISELRSEING